MKKIFILLVAVVIVNLFLVSCGSDKAESKFGESGSSKSITVDEDSSSESSIISDSELADAWNRTEQSNSSKAAEASSVSNINSQSNSSKQKQGENSTEFNSSVSSLSESSSGVTASMSSNEDGFAF